MRRKSLAIVLMLVAVFGLFSCKKEEEKKPAAAQTHEITGTESENKKEDKVEEVVETIYAKTPEEAADKCLKALYSGQISDAKHYVMPNGNAFKELNDFREKTIASFGVEGNEKLTQKAEKLIDNTFLKFNYQRLDVKKSGDTATVTYSVSMPDMANINYSLYIDSYMAAKGISQEELMTGLEGMSEEEAENWSKEFGLDVMNYIFESGGDFARASKTTTVTVKNSKKGWLVSDIKNLAG